MTDSLLNNCSSEFLFGLCCPAKKVKRRSSLNIDYSKVRLQWGQQKGEDGNGRLSGLLYHVSIVGIQ